MLKHDKMYRVVVSTLAVMLVASFLLAAASFVALPSAQAATCDSCTWTNPSCNTEYYWCNGWDFWCWIDPNQPNNSYLAHIHCQRWCMDGSTTCKWEQWWNDQKVGCCQ